MPQAAVKPAVICEYGTVPVNNFRNDNSNPSRANGIARKRLFPYGYFGFEERVKGTPMNIEIRDTALD
jgi:hypothetical protein